MAADLQRLLSSLTLILLLFPTATSSSTISPASAPSAGVEPPPPVISTSTLDPKQLRALQSLNLPTGKDPCSPLHSSVTVCDGSDPFRHLISLKLSNCSDDVALSLTALKSLSTLTDLEFVDCPISPIRFPSELASNLRSFTAVNSLKKLTGVWLGRLQSLSELNVSRVPIKASGPFVILNSIKNLKSLTISQANLTGFLPRHWNPNLTYIDLSGNSLRGRIPSSLTELETLEILNLSSNSLNGTIPTSFGDLNSLKNVSLSSNSLSGPIPDSLAAIPGLVHLDLGSNQLNGTIPKFLSEMKGLKFLNLENNNFQGIFPFNASFIKRLSVLKIGENSNLCYNHTTLMSSKLKLGIAPCDKHGLPMSPPSSSITSGSNDNDDGDNGDDDDDNDDGDEPRHHSHGPSKLFIGFAIFLSAILFVIVFMILCLCRGCK
ncbi:unnamed protein product [Cuscuta campestris]|uniref:Leucine-rich repeat-containing N-terminal plant-type domain-containing protein n=1 Tax=Cuscuta campestris TaxID=132261 RepID=A0A484N2P7_9ASTE|nr:unnamed protein product [Cuscuta campestris]